MRWPLYVALAALALGAALAGLRESAAVPWFMVAVGLLASTLGLGVGLVASGLASLLLFFQGVLDLFALAALFLTAFLSHEVGKGLHQAHARAKLLAQTHGLLAEALEALPRARNREELLKSLPERLARLGERGHVGVWVPERQGLRLLAAHPSLSVETIPYGGVVGRAYREGRPVYVSDVRRDPDYIAPPDHKALAELALPLRERGEVVAVLNLERDRTFPEELQEGLKRFAQAVSLQLSRLADEEERRLVAELSLALQSASRLEEAAAKALALLVRALGLEAGAFWEVRGARMVCLAAHGVEEPTLRKVLEEGLPYGVGLAWRVYETRSPLFTARYAEEDRTVPALRLLDWRTFAALPVPTPGAPRARRVFVVGQRAERLWRKSEVDLLLLASRTLGLGLERLTEKARHEAVNRIFLELLEKPPEELYQAVLEEAIRQVPGAEAGSLLVWEDGAYRYKAAHGYDLEGLKEVAFTREAQLRWYGLGEEKALQGEPRLLSVEERPIAEISHETAPPEIIDTAGKPRRSRPTSASPSPTRGRSWPTSTWTTSTTPTPSARTPWRPPASSPRPSPPSSTKSAPGSSWKRPPSPPPSRACPTAGPLTAFWKRSSSGRSATATPLPSRSWTSKASSR